MSLDTDPSVADNQRNRAFRRQSAGTSAPGKVEPPRQRRPALAALAVLLIVGGALVAGLLAIRMDSREPVVAAARDIDAGTLITADDLREVSVAAEDVPVIPVDAVRQILNGSTYADVPIKAGSLVDQNMLTPDNPVGEGRAEVSVPLNPARTPGSALRSGDVVQVVRVSGGAESSAGPQVLTEGLVISVETTASDDLAGGGASGAVRLLVPTETAAAVVDAAGSDLAGLALLRSGQPSDVALQAGEAAASGPEAAGGSPDGAEDGS